MVEITCLVSLTALCAACGGGGSPQPARQTTDNTSPVITLIGDNPQIIAVGDPYIELGATAIDSVDGDLTTSIVIDASPVDDSVPGSYIVTYNVRDAAGNAADTVTRTVIYEDRTPPLITLVGDNPQILLLGTPYTELGATATDNVDGDLTASIVIDANAVDPSVPGDYSVSYDVSDTAGNAAATVVRTVTYEDRTPPVITLVGSNPQIILLGNPYIELGATATDNVDGDLTASIVIDASGVVLAAIGDYLVAYDVSDAAGNAAITVTRAVSVIYVDSTPPVITLLGNDPQFIAVGDPYTELGATASDNWDGDLTASIVIDASAIDSSAPGVYLVTYNVRDAAGNAAVTVTRTVTYEDRTPPVITLLGNDPQIIAVGDPYTELGATASDNWDGDLTASIVIDASAVDSSVPGDYSVSYDVSDAAGNAAITVMRTVSIPLPVPPEPTVSATGYIKQLIFSWTDADFADFYRLLENPDGHTGFTQVGDDIPADTLSVSRDIAVHLFDWLEAQYIVEACNTAGCSSSDVVTVTDAMLDTIGVFDNAAASNFPGDGGERFPHVASSTDGNTVAFAESGGVSVFRYSDNAWYQQARISASNADADDRFGGTWSLSGAAIALNSDGNTLAVGAYGEDSNATGINGDQADNSALDAGAVYLFRFDGTDWHQQAYIKASNADGYDDQIRDYPDSFGVAVALSADGNTLVVGAHGEDSNATGINGDQENNDREASGAVYVFRFYGSEWGQQAYVKASDASWNDLFGRSVALNADGNTLAVGAIYQSFYLFAHEDEPRYPHQSSGAVYVFRFANEEWSEQALLKASNMETYDYFGGAVTLSADGNTLAVGAYGEDSNATGINGDQDDNSAEDTGAAYVFRFDGLDWYQHAYVKAPNTIPADRFGWEITLSADAQVLTVYSELWAFEY
jgi:hypothetical protein